MVRLYSVDALATASPYLAKEILKLRTDVLAG